MKVNQSKTVFKADSLRSFEAVADIFRMGLFALENGLICYANAHFYTALGYTTPEELQGKPLADLLHPDDRNLVKDGGVSLDGATGQPVRLKMAGGKTFWALIGFGDTGGRACSPQIGYLIPSPAIRTMNDTRLRYEAILNNADLHLSEIDLDANMVFINDAGCRMWGVAREALIGQGYQQYLEPEELENARKLFRKIYHAGKPLQNLLYEYKRGDGRLRMVEDSISLIRNSDGDISGFVMAIKDITDRWEAENKLNEQRRRLEAIFSSVQDALIMVDPQLRVIEANKSAEQICGYPLADIIGREFAPCRAHCSQACRDVLRQTLEGRTIIREYRIECDRQDCNGQVVSVSSSPLLDGRGDFIGAVLVIRDVTLLRDLERELYERHSFANLIGRSKKMQKIYTLVEDLVNLTTTVLVTGESGTGKDLIARALHYGGNRAFKPFITVNCSALPENLLESELFGHVKGAFTGAIKDKQGRFAAAAGGTILLDEIGDISPIIQLKLLRVLQEKEFERVGETIPQKIDVRIIACTNKNLREKVRNLQFRQDLYYRLKVMEIGLPPLRDRLEDLPLLVEHFRLKFNEKFDKRIEDISTDVLNTLMAHPWPGNVRELEHVMEHAFVLCHGGTITLNNLPADIRTRKKRATDIYDSIPKEKKLLEQEISAVLRRTDWNIAKSARLLGVSRPTLYRKIRELRLQRRRINSTTET